jgi:squalene-associated FAD-dependent desaturase
VNPAIIVGGGLSGLAAAVALAHRSVPVLLLEQKPFLGGRAYSFSDRSTGTEVDNGQHLLIAGYSATLAFLKTLGTLPLVSIQDQPELVFHHPERGFRRLAVPPWPPPFNLLWGMMRTDLFTAEERAQVIRGGVALLRSAERIPAEWTIADWLAGTGQGDETRRSFWEPLAVAIMNERPETASARVFVRSLRKAFLSGRRGGALAVPSVGLSRLYAEPAEAFILKHRGSVRRSAEVVELVVRDGSAAAVRLKDGLELPSSAVVLAVPPAQAARLVPAGFAPPGLVDMPLSPIVSIYLWFDSSFMKEDAVGVIGRTVQWVFRKKGHVSVTISAAYGALELDNAALVRTAVEDLRAVYGSPVGEPMHALVVREKRATISCSPAVESRRPGHQTGLPNVMLAGDWTDTGLPATIEGAVISGNRAAEAVFERIHESR